MQRPHLEVELFRNGRAQRMLFVVPPAHKIHSYLIRITIPPEELYMTSWKESRKHRPKPFVDRAMREPDFRGRIHEDP